ncbi:hypothetical protein FRC20_008156 [Serendipita sp. 405]|nr:hypothetical protein FRC16_001142 [Serendipita sp. 398]KAG8823451.1 hypothetical protein FRC18_010726 [Serendipita sp. 400]KAG8831309.1 hypothetical protein FRC20_008156 [Serendipita sp. 405]
MNSTPKLTAAMMHGGGVYESIIGQTATPRANDKGTPPPNSLTRGRRASLCADANAR